MNKEGKFQSKLIRDLEAVFPGCIVLKNDPNYIQGIPDLTVLYNQKWALLECKESAKALKRTIDQPNQDYYVKILNRMGFARYIYPENKHEIINQMIIYFNYSARGDAL